MDLSNQSIESSRRDTLAASFAGSHPLSRLATLLVTGHSISVSLSHSLGRLSSYYHDKTQFSHLLQVISSEIVDRAKQIIGKDMCSDADEVSGETIARFSTLLSFSRV